jgi:lysophospholipase L1-like esterase
VVAVADAAPVTAADAPDASSATIAAPEPSAAAATAPPPITIAKGTRVLMFGDSMVTSGLGVYLEERVREVGGKWMHISKPSSTTVSWADGHDLPDLIARARPDVVIIALLSNELFVPNPRARIYAVREIMKHIGARPCLWVGPPSWRPDKGIVAVARETATSCRFFDSASLDLERQSDGIHPTNHGGRVWGDAVWQGTFVAH